MKIRFIFAFLLCFSTATYAAIVENDHVFLAKDGSFGENYYRFDIFEGPQTSDFTSLRFEYSNGMILNPSVTVDEGSDWYVVSTGANFNSASIAEGLFPVLVNTVESNNITLSSKDFFLAFNTGISDVGLESRGIFGWVHLSDINGELTLEKTAITYDDGGIVINTPLPTSALLLASSLFSLGAAARKHSKTRATRATIPTV